MDTHINKHLSFGDLYSLDEEIIRSLESMGYKHPTKVQEKVIPYILNHQDLVVRSKTGSGKTAAFGIPLIQTVEIDLNAPQALILTPTRELAVQINEELSQIGKYKKIRCLPIYGKQPIQNQINQLKQRVHIAVGSPGRVADLIRQEFLKLDQIKYLIIDEADELLRRGFLSEVEEIINQVPVNRTTLLLSATMPDAVEHIASRYMNRPIQIQMDEMNESKPDIKQSVIFTEEKDKLSWVYHLLKTKTPYTSIIFCRTKNQIDDYCNQLRKLGISATPLHGDMPQRKRLRSLKEFKDGHYQCLVATDLAARGIHINQIDLIINVHVPHNPENYIHRIGRTGRAGEKGEAISLVSPDENKAYRAVLTYIDQEIPILDEPLIDTFKQIPTNNKPKARANNKRKVKPKPKPLAHPDIQTIRINLGKDKKLRPGDIVGLLCNSSLLSAEDIGIIDVQSTCTYVDIFHYKGEAVFNYLQTVKIKGKPAKPKIIHKPFNA